ncbi:MAG: alpha-amylase family protein [Gemmatimonadota bacterium]|nr:alpha-amylase family protein [Gemmatimonadota bacterium]
MRINRKINRKEFFSTLGTGCILLSQVGLGLTGCSGGIKRKGLVSLDRRGFIVDGRVYPLYSGSIHYWRHERELWPLLLERLSRMGLNTVCTSIPWGVHETGPEKFDFGHHDPRRDVGAFLDLAAGRGFKVIVRPGPQVGGELTLCGLPQRVLFDPEIAARTSVDTVEVYHSTTGQFPVPSYFSSKFYREAAVYFDALMPILTGRLHRKGGPVIAVQADSEISFFRRLSEPYTIDYHPEALELYRRRLEHRYESSIAELNRLYRTGYASFDEVEPPGTFAADKARDLPCYLDWVEFREWGLVRAVERFSIMFAERGMDSVPVFTCLPGDFRSPANIPDTESLTLVAVDGLNGFPGREDYVSERELCRAASGLNLYPFRPSFGAGCPLDGNHSVRTAEDAEFVTLASLMHGVKALNYDMAVERDRWLASPLRRDGRIRDELYRTYRRIFQFLRETRFHEYRKVVETIFLYNNCLDRMACSMKQGKASINLGLGGEVFAETVDFGFNTSPGACSMWIEQTMMFMWEAGFDFNIGSTRLPAERLLEYRVALLPTIDFLCLDDLPALEEYVQGGGILVFGPEMSSLSERMEPVTRVRDFFAQAVSADGFKPGISAAPPLAGDRQRARPGEPFPGKGSLIRMESPLEISGLLKALGIDIHFTRSNSRFDVSVHQAPDGRRIVFIANGTGRQEKTDIFFPGRHSFRNLMDGQDFEGEGKVTMQMPPYKIDVWEVS